MNILMVLCTVFAVWQILIHFGVFEYSKGKVIIQEDVQEQKKKNRNRRIEKSKLRVYSDVTETFRGIFLSPFAYENHKYIIERLNIRSEIMGRLYTPEELKGKYIIILGAGLICIPFGFYAPVFWIGTVTGILFYNTYMFVYKQKVDDEDIIIDENFLDLYLLMYAKLRQGSRARLHSVVDSYIQTLDTAQEIEVRETMSKLAEFLLNNLGQYPDHIAVIKLKERYKSATMVNFCNVAAQALQGIDNSDNLLTFKMALVRRKTAMMEARAVKLCAKGERSIYCIYIILFIFIGVGWYSKLPTGFF